MTVKGEATDGISRQYQRLLSEAEGGVYLALTGHHHDSLKMLLEVLDLAVIETKGKSWSYLSFPSDSFLAHVFFIDYHFEVSSMDDLTDHPNGMSGLKNVAIEGGDKLTRFFEAIGLWAVRDSPQVFETATGNITVVPLQDDKDRPRVTRIQFAGDQSTELEINW